MAISRKTNAAPATTDGKADTTATLNFVLATAKAAKTAALTVTASIVFHLLTVAHFRSKEDDGFETKADAMAQIRKEFGKGDIASNTLAMYVSIGGNAFTKMTGKGKTYSALIQRLAGIPDPEKAVSAIVAEWNANGLTGFNKLQRAMKTTTRGAAKTDDPASVVVQKRANTAIKSLMAAAEELDVPAEDVSVMVASDLAKAVPIDAAASMLDALFERLLATDGVTFEQIDGWLKLLTKKADFLLEQSKHSDERKATAAKGKSEPAKAEATVS